jgi:hypothetical protein
MKPSVRFPPDFGFAGQGRCGKRAIFVTNEFAFGPAMASCIAILALSG